MRVIAGTAKSIPLKAPEGLETRPTTDKIKETLFNILQFDIQGAQFLDIFAGSGAMGIEALSRGALSAIFVDEARNAELTINENLAKCRLKEKACVIRTGADNVERYIHRINRNEELIIFMDPPYNKGLEFNVLRRLLSSGIITEDTTVIIEEALNADMLKAEEIGFDIVREKKYKNQKHVFLKLKGSCHEGHNLDISGEL